MKDFIESELSSVSGNLEDALASVEKLIKNLPYLNDKDTAVKFINVFNRTRRALEQSYSEISSGRFMTEIRKMCMKNSLGEPVWQELIYSETEALFDGFFYFKMPLLPSSGTVRITNGAFMETAGETNHFFEFSAMEAMKNLVSGMSGDELKSLRKFSEKYMFIIHNYSNDTHVRAVPDASNHYTAKIENAILDYLPNADGGTCGTGQMNMFSSKIETSTYIIIIPADALKAGIDIERLLCDRWG